MEGTNLGQDDNRGNVAKGFDDLLRNVCLSLDQNWDFGGGLEGPFRMQNRQRCQLRKRGIVDHLFRNTCETIMH